MRILIVHNQASGFGSSAIFEFERALVGPGDECVLRTLSASMPVAEAMLDAESFDLVVVSGGDGTATNALYALRQRGVATCVFPTGTANLLAASIGNATEPAGLAKACRNLRTSALDIGELSWTMSGVHIDPVGFALMSGMGFDAQLMADAQANKRMLGEAAYFAAALANLRPQLSTFTVVVDGIEHVLRGISCMVANTAMIQGEISLVPGCRMNDGQLDVMVLSSPVAVQLLLPVLAGIVDPAGDILGRPHIEHFQGRHIEVRSSVSLNIQRDGDVLEGKAEGFVATCLPGACQVVVDQGSPYFGA